jgi:hypothetical protein
LFGSWCSPTSEELKTLRTNSILNEVHGLEINSPRGQSSFQSGDVGRVQLVRELNVELNDETALLKRVPILRHALAANELAVAVLDDFTGNSLNEKRTVVEGLDRAAKAAQGLDEFDLHAHHEVVARAPAKEEEHESTALRYSTVYTSHIPKNGHPRPVRDTE